MTKSLRQKLVAYYTKYYKDQLCLPSYEKWVQRRLNKEINTEERVERLQAVLGDGFFDGKHLFVGAGTGELAMGLLKHGSEVYGLEPNKQAIEIIHERCAEQGIDKSNFVQGFAEKIPFDDDYFDVVHCFWVLEHVQDVAKSIAEMIRVAEPGGKIYIKTPNYNYPYDGHYKMLLPTFLPKIFSYLYLALRGKSPMFLKSVNFVTKKSIDKILKKKSTISWHRFPSPIKRSGGKIGWLLNYLKFNLNINPNQEILITKIN